PVVVITPQRRIPSPSIAQLAARPGTTHLTWRESSGQTFAGTRVLHAWPDRQRVNDIWDHCADALVVVEWVPKDIDEWIVDTRPLQLCPGEVRPTPATSTASTEEPIAEEVGRILESIAGWAAGYSSGLKWNEEDKLKADMMNRPDRWADVTVGQLRSKCRELGM